MTTTPVKIRSVSTVRRMVSYIGIMSGAGVLLAIVTALVTITQYVAPTVIFPSVLFNDDSNSATLTWTAPGDDGSVGQATAYDVRYATSAITEQNWDGATAVANPPTPGTAGTQESFVVGGLNPSTTYYFAIKTVDEAGNWSPVSNIASKSTTCVEAWSCTDWSQCANGQQSRTCSDLNNCGTENDKPAVTQSCETLPPVCNEDWTCTEWSACSNGQQQRSCSDQNACGTNQNRPGESRACEEQGGGGAGEGGEELLVQDTYVVAGLSAGAGPQIRVLDKTGRVITQFFAYEESFRGGVNIAVADLGSDGIDEIVVGPGPGREPLVKIFTYRGDLINQFMAYAKEFRGGVNVAIGDIDGQTGQEVVTAPASRGGPNIQIFGYRNGQYRRVIENFFAYNERFRGEISMSVADLDNDGRYEILTVPGENSGGPHVRIFVYNGSKMITRTLGFMAYASNFRGGVSFATGDTENDGFDEIMTAPVTRGGPHVRFFGRRADGSVGLKNPGYFVFDENFRGGVSIAAGDFDFNDKDELVVGVRSGDQALVKIYRSDGKQVYHQFTAFPSTVRTGIRLATGQFFAPR